MRLFAIGDLHLSGGAEKPMDVFGPQWDRHFLRISENWRRLVGPEDAVLIPGDISWAMQLEDALPDLEEIAHLPGKKILCKGNHDYWWPAVSRLRAALPEGMRVLQYDAADLGPCVVCGTRGWLFPAEGQALEPADDRIYRRELQRLRSSLEAAQRIAEGRPLIAMTHYPPLLRPALRSAFSDLLEEAGVFAAVYGHLHGAGIPSGYTGEVRGVRYRLVSCDSVGFAPAEIPLPDGTEEGGKDG